jgi:hypothetical protein
MMNREKVWNVLRSSFPGASENVIDATADAIAGLGEEWQEVTYKEEELGYHYSPKCADICYFADQATRGAQFRLFQRRRVGSR